MYNGHEHVVYTIDGFCVKKWDRAYEMVRRFIYSYKCTWICFKRLVGLCAFQDCFLCGLMRNFEVWVRSLLLNVSPRCPPSPCPLNTQCMAHIKDWGGKSCCCSYYYYNIGCNKACAATVAVRSGVAAAAATAAAAAAAATGRCRFWLRTLWVCSSTILKFKPRF